MITTAVIFADTWQGHAGATLTVPPLHRLGGLTLLERAILTAERAGARTCYVVGVPNPGITFHTQSTLRCTVVFLRDVHDCSLALQTKGAVLAFSVDVIFSVTLAKALDAYLTRTGVLSVHVPSVPLAVVDAGVLAVGSWDRWRALEPDSGSLAFAPDGYFVRRLGPTVSAAEVEKELLASVANLQDGVLDRYLNRPLSRRLTRRLADLPLRANHVTLFSITVGLMAALLFALVGALRWFLWSAALGVHVFWLTLLWLLWRVREKQWDRGLDW